MPKRIDISGQRIGNSIVIKSLPLRNRHLYWQLKCGCGNTFEKRSDMLNTSKKYPLSCGCERTKHSEKEAKLRQGGNYWRQYKPLQNIKRDYIDRVGEVHGKLTVVLRINDSEGINWMCSCECGGIAIKKAQYFTTEHKYKENCGCLTSEIRIKSSVNPNITDEDRENRKRNLVLGAFAWRKAIIKRDVNCKICGDTSATNIHHIKGWSKHPELRVDVNNGVLLCEECHKDFHSQYGNYNFTKEDFNEFKNNKICLN